jgi:LmbE family N-acetylglucosaminyl deacetylase
MIKLNLGEREDGKLTILCLGAHSDDIEIGCGGTILQLLEKYPNSVVHWVVFSAIGVRGEEARRAAVLFAGPRIAGGPNLKEFRDGFMPFVGADVKQVMEDLKRTVAPDLIFTHYGRDAHQDHRLISQLTWNTFRDHLVLEYEIPKFDGDFGQPNGYVSLSPEVCQKKVDHLMNAFQSQREKRWFEESTFMALMRLRGMECNSPSRYAEAFYLRKVSF